MTPNYCEVCANRSTCSELCPKAEKWVSKGQRYQRELPVAGAPNLNAKYPNTPLDYLAWKAEITGRSWQHIQDRAHTRIPEFDFLSEEEMKALRYLYDYGMTLKEIARRMSKKEFSVKSMLVRARKKIASTCHKNEGVLHWYRDGIKCEFKFNEKGKWYVSQAQNQTT
jgi:predicted DNA-binding protein (UPF0251 family)